MERRMHVAEATEESVLVPRMASGPLYDEEHHTLRSKELFPKYPALYHEVSLIFDQKRMFAHRDGEEGRYIGLCNR